MICRTCIRRATALHPLPLARPYSTTISSSTTSPRPSGPPSATSTSAAQPFSTPLSPTPNPISLGVSLRPKPSKTVIPVSSCPAGTPLKGLNFLKGMEDPVALAESEYPEWLWGCLDKAGGKKSGVGEGGGEGGDVFSKSKKQRRTAAKAQRKHELKLIASGNTEALTPKIPIQQQSIDLPWNREGSVEGAREAAGKREEVRSAMRQERRAKIKESNFLKGMR